MATKDKCPKCGKKNVRTVDSRLSGESDILRVRRKLCTHCDFRFDTFEVFADENSIELRVKNMAAVREFLSGVEELARRNFGNDRGYFQSKIKE